MPSAAAPITQVPESIDVADQGCLEITGQDDLFLGDWVEVAELERSAPDPQSRPDRRRPCVNRGKDGGRGLARWSQQDDDLDQHDRPVSWNPDRGHHELLVAVGKGGDAAEACDCVPPRASC